MTARERFKKGDKVQYSSAWLNQSQNKRQRAMTVIGFGQEPQFVRVVYDGLFTPHTFHMNFIELRSEPVPTEVQIHEL